MAASDSRKMLDRGIYATDETLRALDELENGQTSMNDLEKQVESTFVAGETVTITIPKQTRFSNVRTFVVEVGDDGFNGYAVRSGCGEMFASSRAMSTFLRMMEDILGRPGTHFLMADGEQKPQ